MDTTTGHDATGQDTTDTTRHDATPTEVVATVPEAARLLGISEGAVRKRIERGQLRAAKVKNQWQIIISSDDLIGVITHDATRHDQTGHDATDTTARDAAVVAPAAVAQLEAIRDQWLRPFVDRIGELEREAGRLQAERDAALVEVRRLHNALEPLTTSLAVQGATGNANMAPDPSPSPPSRWRRWVRALVGG